MNDLTCIPPLPVNRIDGNESFFTETHLSSPCPHALEAVAQTGNWPGYATHAYRPETSALILILISSRLQEEHPGRILQARKGKVDWRNSLDRYSIRGTPEQRCQSERHCLACLVPNPSPSGASLGRSAHAKVRCRAIEYWAEWRPGEWRPGGGSDTWSRHGRNELRDGVRSGVEHDHDAQTRTRPSPPANAPFSSCTAMSRQTATARGTRAAYRTATGSIRPKRQGQGGPLHGGYCART